MSDEKSNGNVGGSLTPTGAWRGLEVGDIVRAVGGKVDMEVKKADSFSVVCVLAGKDVEEEAIQLILVKRKVPDLAVPFLEEDAPEIVAEARAQAVEIAKKHIALKAAETPLTAEELAAAVREVAFTEDDLDAATGRTGALRKQQLDGAKKKDK